MSEQSAKALLLANEVRSARAVLKQRIRDGEVRAQDVLSDPPDYIKTASLMEILRAIPWVSFAKANRFCKAARVNPGRRVGDLTSRQREALIDAVDGR